jgi:hypothetical protein
MKKEDIKRRHKKQWNIKWQNKFVINGMTKGNEKATLNSFKNLTIIWHKNKWDIKKRHKKKSDINKMT